MPLRRLILLTISVVSLQGCDYITGGDHQDVEQKLKAAKLLWAARASQSYEYSGQLLCFCGFGGADARVVVLNDSVISVVVQDTVVVPEPFRGSYRTVDQLFELLDEAIRTNAYRITAEFDSQSGYPSDFFIDYSENAADEEFGYRITTLLHLR